MTLDELLLEWSYRSEKGYPDMGNPSDILLLEKILKDLNLPTSDILNSLKEQEKKEDQPTTSTTNKPDGTTEYDNLIKDTLGVDSIPRSKNNYKYPGSGGSTYVEQVKPDDLEIWQKLWTAKPEKKTEKGVETAGVGKGELSLYWLYNYSNSKVEVSEGRAGDDPDLFFNGNGVEVKAYSSHNAKLSIGKYGADKENLRLLGIIFGISTLARVFGGEGTDKTINPTNFKGTDLENAFESVAAFNDIDLDQLSGIYPIFKQIKDNLDFLTNKLEFNNAKEGALAMGRKFLKDKLNRKPGDGNHLVNIMKSGSMKFWLVDFSTLDSDDDILDKMSSSQSAMNLNFTKTFG